MLKFKNCRRSHETFQNNPFNTLHVNRFIQNLQFIVTMNSSILVEIPPSGSTMRYSLSSVVFISKMFSLVKT